MPSPIRCVMSRITPREPSGSVLNTRETAPKFWSSSFSAPSPTPSMVHVGAPSASVAKARAGARPAGWTLAVLAGGVMDACRGVRDLLVLSTLEGLHVILDGVQRAQHKVEDHYVDDEVWRQLPNHLNRGDGQGGGSGD